MFRIHAFVLSIALATTASAAEVTLQNDSLVGNTSGIIQSGFVAGEMAASWLTSPCDGSLVAVQIFWRSGSGGAADSIQRAIHIYRSGTFPAPGAVALDVVGPVLTDGVINEYRYLDENSTIPIAVPVTANETVVVALEFETAPPQTVGPSVVNDTDGIVLGRNAIYGDIGLGDQWYGSSEVLISGDWVIRAVVDCNSIPTEANIGVTIAASPAGYVPGGTLEYTITASNAGPAAAGVAVAALFPGSLQNVSWTCAASAGAACGLASGIGNILQSVTMPMGGEVIYDVTTTVDPGASGTIEVSTAASPNAPVTDPDTSNNNASVSTPAADNDLIFADGFETTPP